MGGHPLRLGWALALGFGLASQAGAAQAPAILRDAALRAYVAEVLERNAGLAAAEAGLRAAEQRIAPAGALPDPTLALGVMSAPTPSFDLDREPMTQFPVSLQQAVPFPGKLRAAAEVARRETEVAASRLELEARTLAASAAAAFFELAYARSAIEVWRDRLELAEHAVRVARSRYETGQAPQTEVLRAEVRRAELLEEGYELAAELEAAAARLDALRGGPGDLVRVPELASADSALVHAVLRDRLPPLDSLRRALAARSPVLALAGAEVERARASAGSTRIAARPDLALGLQYAPRAGREAFVSAMLGISLPAWTGRKQGPAAEAARLEWEAARRRKQDVRARLEAELRERVARLAGLRQAVKTLRRDLLPLAEVASESALRSYAAGAVDLTAVLDAQDDLYRTRLALARRIATYAAQRAALSALLGEEWYR